MGDLTSQRLIRIAGALGALISVEWLILAIRSTRDAHSLASSWNGITCCDPKEDIGAFYMLTALCLAFLVISYLLAWLKDSPTAALVLVFIIWFHERNHVVPYQSKWQSPDQQEREQTV